MQPRHCSTLGKSALIFLGIVVALFLFINIPPGRTLLSHIASHYLQREVLFEGALYPVLTWPPTLHISRLTVANREGGVQPMVHIGEAEISVAPKPLLRRGRFVLAGLSLIDSELHLEVDKDDAANWNFNSDKSAREERSGLPPIRRFYLQNSSLTYRDVPLKTDVSLNAKTQGRTIMLTGDGMHLGREFALDAKLDYTRAARKANAIPIDLAMQVGHTKIHAKGIIEDPTHFKGFELKFDIAGADAAELFPLFGIALPPTSPYSLSGALAYQTDQWQFHDFTGKMGKSDIHGNLLWDTSNERPKLTAEFISNNLSFTDLGPLIGTAPTTPVSPEQKQKAVEQQVSPYVIPDIPLDISKLSAMDADVSFTGKKVISQNLPLDDFYLKAVLNDRVLKLVPVKFGTANGDIEANITVDARNEPVEDTAEIALKRLSLARLMEGFGHPLGANLKRAEGYIGGMIKVKGRGKSLHDVFSTSNGTVGIGMEGGRISNLLIELIGLDVAESLGFILSGDRAIPIRCVVTDFAVEKGVMNSNIFVIDTSDTNIHGEGTVGLGSEELDLRLVPEPKDATVLSLRSPILITGTLKHPKVSVEVSRLAARSSIAAGIAALAPVAAVLAFIEPGLGKDSNCAALMHELDRDNKETKTSDHVPENKN
jgi:uncharacterized protein involved in outer membrane biogenesis